MGVRTTLLAVLLSAAALTACGGDDRGFGLVDAATADPNPTDAAFARAMVLQEKEALALAELARERALRRELRKIAKQMIRARGAGTGELSEIAAELARDGIRPAGAEMNRRRTDARELHDPVSFDFRFMELMIRHLERSVAMAEEEQDRGGHPRLKHLAGELMERSQRELEALRRWLRTWYGDGVLPPGGGGGGGGDGEAPAPDGDGGEGPGGGGEDGGSPPGPEV